MTTESLSPFGQFQNYFDLFVADPHDTRAPERNAGIIARCHRLRYEVYCREFGFEREEDCPGQMERDEYDDQSLHCLLVHRSTQSSAGTVRLVLSRPDAPEQRLPFWAHCEDSLFAQHPNHPACFPPGSYAEISRLAVGGAFRRRPGEQESPIGQIEGQDFTDVERRTFPLISLCLFLAASSLVVLSGREYAYAIMEPRLARRLASAGMLFERIGSDTDYHGLRAAFYTDTQLALSALDRIAGMREIFDAVTHGVRMQLAPGAVRIAPALQARFGG
ncbi:N-acyl amino acid synthase of PEP-CTERM/exosortase system [Plasticicumulans lactativorans]|uniref:N-acyl amino acid synthase of PEP-CTERM/exosortase system n=1 Tax=Plasticicumulans lactativorans TaxID=1133106 RepID=A0A4R2LDA8_9GAMM|nr:PEP-CTERM/exosortase system-associated acyltransferase [Plasticicumulans lactativorans]TCO82436.1 N-acyl amino acid synthase of PEP-CTERM/exosortase system [Plasticicumulans lactativorans]